MATFILMLLPLTTGSRMELGQELVLPAALPELPIPVMLSLGLGMVALLRVTRRYRAV